MSMLHNKQSLGHVLSALKDLTTRFTGCTSEDERVVVMENWKKSCLVVTDRSLENTTEFVYGQPWKRAHLKSLEECIQKDMAMLQERIKQEQERLESAKELHASIMELMMMNKGTKNKGAKKERAMKKKRGHDDDDE